MPAEAPNQPDRIYQVRLKDVPEEELIRRGHRRLEEENIWGGNGVEISLNNPGYPAEGWYDWLYVGEEFIKRLHRACGEYLARKAEAERNAND